MLPGLDHLLIGAASLKSGMDWAAETFGVRPEFGGRHPDLGTENALLFMSDQTYIEVIAPTAGGEDTSVLSRELSRFKEPGLYRWCIRATHLSERKAALEAAGFAMGPVVAGSRTTKVGEPLTWTFMFPVEEVGPGPLPFIIDWQGGPHPTDGRVDQCIGQCKGVTVHRNHRAHLETYLETILGTSIMPLRAQTAAGWGVRMLLTPETHLDLLSSLPTKK